MAGRATRSRAPGRAAAVALAALGGALLAGCGEEPPPPEPLPAGPPVLSLAAGGGHHYASHSHVCAAVAGSLQCWGANGSGQLGVPPLGGRRPLPARVPGLPAEPESVAAGRAHTCVTAAGHVLCWGASERGQTGALGADAPLRVRRVPGLPGRARALASGPAQTCAVAGRGAFCWGDGADGALGEDGPDTCGDRPLGPPCSPRAVRVAGIPEAPEELAVGSAFACARMREGAPLCWGRNDRGQLGAGSSGSRARAAPVEDLADGVSALAAGSAFACAIAADGVYCWGANDRGQVAVAGTRDRPHPMRVAGLPDGVDALSLGAAHGCALVDGDVLCWGASDAGQLGPRAPLPETRAPVRVPLSEEAVAVAAGRDVSCAALASGRVACWGDNDFGQLGRADVPGGARPVRVAAWDRGAIRDTTGDGVLTVACVGDSNTRRPGLSRAWCEILGERLPEGWRTRNRGRPGATAVRVAGGAPAEEPLEHTLRSDAPDAVILALGAADLFLGARPAPVAAAIARFAARILEAGAVPLVALVPPDRSDGPLPDAALGDLNARLREIAPAEWLVDFHSGMSDEHLADPVHLGEAGHERAARAAWETLRALGASAAAPSAPAAGEPAP